MLAGGRPDLAAALALAAGLEGIREGLDPGLPNEDNLYELSEAQRRERGIEFLPQTLQEAVQAFAADPRSVTGVTLCTVLGDGNGAFAKALGLELSPTFIARADAVIE